MTNLTGVVRQLQNERQRVRRKMEQLNAALAALGSLGALGGKS
jgi:DNA anti-recombination protein RmuC